MNKYLKISFLLIIVFAYNTIWSQSVWDWVDGPSTSNYEAANAIAIDSLNQFIYVAGVISEVPTAYTDILPAEMNGATDNGMKDGFVAKYDFNGNEYIINC